MGMAVLYALSSVHALRQRAHIVRHAIAALSALPVCRLWLCDGYS